ARVSTSSRSRSASRMPARTYSVSAEMRSALATCWSTSALGLRSPRSIWLRYGLDTPAASASCRSESRALRRCSRRYSPRLPTLSDAMSPPCTTAANYCKHLLAIVRHTTQGVHPLAALPCLPGGTSGSQRSDLHRAVVGVEHDEAQHLAPEEPWHALADPEGNEFCLLR